MMLRVISLRETPQRLQACRDHFASFGMTLDVFYGVNAAKWGLLTKNAYEVDHPGTGFHIPQKHVGLHLSHYFMWRESLLHPFNVHGCVEDDCRFVGDLKEGQTLPLLLADYREWIDLQGTTPTMIFLGSCNCSYKPSVLVDERLHLYKVEWPQCTHAYLFNKAAAALLIETQEKSWAPIDLALIFNSFPVFKERGGQVLTVLPRLFDQGNQQIHP